MLIEIDSYSDSNGCVCGVQALASSLGLPSKTIKATLKSLQSKGALEVRIDEDGAKRLFVYLYKERYVENPDAVIIGDKPSDVITLPYDEIAEKWAEICVSLPKITRWSPQRKNKLRSALKQADLTVEDLYKVFRIIACTPFLSGESDKFKCSFEWLTSKSSNLEKVYTGFYSRSYQEKRDYELIMGGGKISQQSKQEEDYYR
ncbi:hypothetical protein [Clavibacter sp.]|uniref:hypothetical protein n=1 Tax=Clavibacter sp. TaxID=1871044 RepID=UPI0019B293C9|nr:hypothetical protein [Clavibacter sp.]MBD5381928.1 hypothetical protein [Clavibacter sp.]